MTESEKLLMSGSVSGSGSAGAANDLSLVLLFQLSPYGCSHAACLPELFSSKTFLLEVANFGCPVRSCSRLPTLYL